MIRVIRVPFLSFLLLSSKPNTNPLRPGKRAEGDRVLVVVPALFEEENDPCVVELRDLVREEEPDGRPRAGAVLVFDGPERREVLLGPFNQRIRDIQLGPDGNLYVATEGQTGGNATDGMILKIEPVN